MINKIKKYYFINKFDTNIIDKQDKHTIIIFRNYNSKLDENLIIKIYRYCKNKSLKFYLSNNVKLAVKLNLDGAYIPAFNNHFGHLAYSLKKNFKIVGSAHNLKEIRLKENQKVEKIFLSSVFKKNKNFLGINKFKQLAKLTNKDVVVLGGVTKTNLKKLVFFDQSEFAGISFFE